MPDPFRQYGWKGEVEAFLFGRNLYYPGDIKIPAANAMSKNMQDIGPAITGSLEEWKAIAAAFFGPSSIEQGIAILASFAAPAWALTQRPSIMLSLHGKTGSGKTMALTAAASVWGGQSALTLSGGSTAVGRYTTLCHLCHLPAIANGLLMRDPSETLLILRDFANGKELVEAMKPPHLSMYYPWRTVILHEHARSLYAVACPPDNRKKSVLWAGIELETKLDRRFRDKNHLRLIGMLMRSRGHAGEHFIRWLVKPDSWHWVNERRKEWGVRLGKDQDDIRYKHRIAFCAMLMTIAEAVRELGLLTFSLDRVRQALQAPGALGGDRSPEPLEGLRGTAPAAKSAAKSAGLLGSLLEPDPLAAEPSSDRP